MPEKPWPFRSIRQRTRAWYDGSLYSHEQPFDTFNHKEENHDWVAQHVADMVSEPHTATALEIGPGNRPLLPKIPFRRRVFLEQSPQLAQGLAHAPVFVKVTSDNLHYFQNDEDFDGLKQIYRLPGVTLRRPIPLQRLIGKPEVIVGGIESVGQAVQGRLDVAVLCEVLTHVRPAQRAAIIEQLTEKADALVIVDREQVPTADMHLKYRQLSAMNREVFRGQRTKQAREWREKSARQEQRSEYFLRQEQQKHVNFQRIVRALKRKGWRVESHSRKHRQQQYTLLKAWRPLTSK